MADTTTEEGKAKFDAFVERMEKVIPDASDTTKAVPKAVPKKDAAPTDAAADGTTDAEHEDDQRDGASDSPDDTDSGDADADEEGDDQEGSTESDTDADSEEGDEEEEGDAPKDGDAGDADDEDEGDADEPDPEFDKAAKQHKIPTSLDDIPKEARPLVEKRLKEIQAGFTRAVTEAREYRAEEAQFRAEQLFREENPIEYALDFIESQMKANPKFAEQLNERWAKLEDPEQQRAFQVIVKDARKGAAEKIDTRLKERDQLVSRADAVQAATEKLAGKLGLPMELADQAIALRIRENAQKPNGKPDITDAEIQEIVTAQAKVYGRHVRAHRREGTKQYIRDKAKDAKQTPVVRSGQGNSPAPGKQSTKGMSLEDRMMQTATRVFPGSD